MKLLSKLTPMRAESVAARVEALREAIGITRGEFADSVGIDRSSYTKIAKAEKPLKAEMAYAISMRWGVSMDFIYKGSLDNLPSRYESAVIAALKAASE